MSAQSGPDVAALLAEHAWASRSGICWSVSNEGILSKMCGWSSSHPSDLTIDQQHRAHLDQDAFTPVEAEIHLWGEEVGHACDEHCDAYREAANAALTALADLLRGQA